MKSNSKISSVALCAILCAQAIAISFLESLIPTSAIMPPGAKLGFSNIVTMFSVEILGIKYALCITAFKALFAFFTRGFTAGLMSFFGGIFSMLVMYLLLKNKKLDIGYIGIAVSSAITHNAAQLMIFVFISATPSVAYYFPVLFFMSLITGSVTGLLLKTVMPVLIKQKKIFIKGGE